MFGLIGANYRGEDDFSFCSEYIKNSNFYNCLRRNLSGSNFILHMEFAAREGFMQRYSQGTHASNLNWPVEWGGTFEIVTYPLRTT